MELPDLAEIRIIRKQLGLTQRELARATGFSQSFINKIERNEADPGYRAAKRIFKTLQDATSRRTSDSSIARDVMTTNVDQVSSAQTVEDAIKLMLKKHYSQLPVIDNGIVKGSLSDRRLLRYSESRQTKIRDAMERRFPIVDPDAKLETIRNLLQEYPAVLVNIGSQQYGIVTKHDLLKKLMD